MSQTFNDGVLSNGLRDGLEDLVGDVMHARRTNDLGRLALLCYCEIRRWARIAGEPRLAELCSCLVALQPACDRDGFLRRVDGVVAELDGVCQRAGIDAGLRARTGSDFSTSSQRCAGPAAG
ncbi:hypothetical protein QTH97_28325 [Variovorax sp. J22R24]|uniref:hypothetical protein n=1 Tax=Variovorax gracilis TaxID=3053502 RepID=UPI0025765A57|nr:hypothetical protein [Variovorax sp. J22R24]MDM0108879.1 hypothetical protein [Variovorax sp. J22R24]